MRRLDQQILSSWISPKALNFDSLLIFIYTLKNHNAHNKRRNKIIKETH